MSKILEGKVAIVTGSGQGIGLETAICMADNGAKVVTNNRKPGSNINFFEGEDLDFTEEEKKRIENIKGDAKTAADLINSKGGEALPYFGDVSDPAAAEGMVKAAVDKWGRVDILVNNAYSGWVGSVAEMTIDQFNVNVISKLSGAFFMMKNVIPFMKKQKFGRILNTASDAYLGLMGMSAYSAASAGLVAFTKATAQDLAEFGITVNSYTPLAKTRSWYNVLAKFRLQGIEAETIEAGAPPAMKRAADTMVPFLAYLSSDDAYNISGVNFSLRADGFIGVWKEPEVCQSIQKEEPGAAWTMEELQKRVPEELMKGVSVTTTPIPLR